MHYATDYVMAQTADAPVKRDPTFDELHKALDTLIHERNGLRAELEGLRLELQAVREHLLTAV